MKIKLIFSSIVIALLVTTSCKDTKKTDSVQNLATNDTTILASLTNKWNESIVKQDYQTLSELYAEQVSIYGLSISKEQAITNKKEFYKIHADFNQSITGEILISKIKDNSYKLLFPKRTNYGGTTSDIKGYLIFEKIADTYKIVNESDETTDKNISKRNIQKIDNGEVKCSDIVLQIIKSSQAYKNFTNGLTQRIKNNGGQGFRLFLWGSPNPKIDGTTYSEDYEYSIHEIYSDHQPRIVDFKFSPKSQQLFKEDSNIAWEYNPIKFNIQLLITFNKTCK